MYIEVHWNQLEEEDALKGGKTKNIFLIRYKTIISQFKTNILFSSNVKLYFDLNFFTPTPTEQL